MLDSDFYHGILDPNVSLHRGVLKILGSELLVSRRILGILYLEFVFHCGILEILDLDQLISS